ncbi:DUF2637 domain-containing protein [Streptomyces sp. HNM0663]|uniref:DUF2637 domain-containing protein n=2 Tax=Streptomyces chengmaiensis TaxID=3040919 RepID=A0ABT6HXM3_9ACTN|nr:DUF2637 domain-containing protein [Streptomyces chengmaiensis]MDH2393145.1 DUF2637 domain-containing protein [Streptomyces chengmaiensis]
MRRPLKLDAVLVQAVIAAALSFAHLHDVAQSAGQDGWKAWAYPVSVDLLLVAAWRRLRTGSARALAWCWFLIALAASLGANVATAGFLDLSDPPGWLRMLVAGWPALAFLGGTLLAHTPSRAPALAPETETVSESDPEPAAGPEPVAEAVEPEPAALPPAPASVPVPAALVEHARKVAAEHQARTGAAIDTPTLRSRLGVPPAMADAIAAQLT